MTSVCAAACFLFEFLHLKIKTDGRTKGDVVDERWIDN